MSENPIEEAIKEIIGENFLTHYIVIAEVMTESGMDLRIGTSDNMTVWQALGMLEVSSDMIAGGCPEWQEKEDE